MQCFLGGTVGCDSPPTRTIRFYRAQPTLEVWTIPCPRTTPHVKPPPSSVMQVLRVHLFIWVTQEAGESRSSPDPQLIDVALGRRIRAAALW